MSLQPAAEPWRIEQANRQRADLAAFGLTERQARFLVQVLLHAGVFVERQYAHFARIAHGQKTADFLGKLVERKYATPITAGALIVDACSTSTTSRSGRPSANPTAGSGSPPPSRPPDRAGDAPRCRPRGFRPRVAGPERRQAAVSSRASATRLVACGRKEYPHIWFGDGPMKVARYFPDKLPIGPPSPTAHLTCSSTWSPSLPRPTSARS